MEVPFPPGEELGACRVTKMDDALFEQLDPVAPGDFGVVVLPNGVLGYYDDDGYDGDCVDDGLHDDDLELLAIIYPGEPFAGAYKEYEMWPHDDIRKVPKNVTYLPLVKWVRDNPEAAHRLGVVE